MNPPSIISNRETTANCLSKLFFCWVCPLTNIRKYAKKYECMENASTDDAERLGNKLETCWEAEKLKTNDNPSLLRVLIKTFIGDFMFYGVFCAIQYTLCFLPPILSRELIIYFTHPDQIPQSLGLMVSGLLVGSYCINVLLHHHVTIQCQIFGNRSRVACSSIIYRKILKLNIFVLRKLPRKDILRILMYETNILERASIYAHYMWVVPLGFILAGILLYDLGGSLVIVGLTYFILITLINCAIAIKYQEYKERCHEYIRMRCLHLSEMVANMKSVKAYCYEKYFHDKIMDYRRKECLLTMRTLYLQATQILLSYLSSRLSFFLTITLAVIIEVKLKSEWVYPVFQIYDVLQLYTAFRFAEAVSSFYQLKKSLIRIKRFLMYPDNIKIHADIPPKGTKMGYIKITDVTADWEIKKNASYIFTHTLENINLEIKPGSLYLIIGAKESGKSSILNLLINEIPVIEGKVMTIGRLSYSSQEPWLFRSSIKQNITFGEPLYRSRYRETIQVCGVLSDLKEYPNTDKSIVGEEVFLDDGQRAKINLARSVYREADIYVFDEPFAALDPPLAKYIFNECLLKYLANKTRILATKHSSFFNDADMIVIVEDGRIKAQGTINDIPKELFPELKTYSIAARQPQSSDSSLGPSYSNSVTRSDIRRTSSRRSMYKRYVRNFITTKRVVLLLIIAVLCQAGFSTWTFWLMHWIYKEDNCFNSSSIFGPLIFEKLDAERNMSSRRKGIIIFDFLIKNETNCTESHSETVIYAIVMILVLTVTVFLCMIKFYYICHQHTRATKNLHDIALRNIVKGKMEFFRSKIDETVTEHFSYDLFAVDEKICKQLLESLHISFLMVGTIIFTCVVYPFMIIVTILYLVILFFMRKCLMKAGKFYHTLWSQGRYPIECHINSTLAGLTTIRCYNANYLVSNEMEDLLNRRTLPHVTFMFLEHMFAFYAEIVSVLYIGIGIFQAFFVPSIFIPTGSALGIFLTEAFIFLVHLQTNMKQSIKFLNTLSSKNYLESYQNLEVETNFVRDNDVSFIKTWPMDGEIEFVNVSSPNYELNTVDVLETFTLKISARDRVAVVGKAGSGKDWIVPLLFHFVEFSGDIFIDNVNICEIGLTLLRNNITLISPTGFVFSATLRKNLDPYDFYDKSVLENALDKVELSSIFSLDTEIYEGNVTFEQKCLISLARAIVCNAKIVVKEETSNILEPSTRKFINKLMESEFTDRTVIFVTNKREEIILTNKTLVLENGLIAAYDLTKNLLKDEKSKLNIFLDVIKIKKDEGGTGLEDLDF